MSGVSESSIYRMEIDQTPGLWLAIMVCQALGLGLDDIWYTD